jgi:hypothetical protein
MIRAMRPTVALLALLACACVAETDRDRYVAGEAGVATFRNLSAKRALYLDGCSAFGFSRRLGDRWLPPEPAHVCVWQGFAQPVPPGGARSEGFVAPGEPGTWRLVYAVGAGCREDRPLAAESCDRVGEVATEPFEVVAPCAERACGPALGMPNRLCADGVSVAGPTGRCLRDPESGACGWEIADCPDAP